MIYLRSLQSLMLFCLGIFCYKFGPELQLSSVFTTLVLLRPNNVINKWTSVWWSVYVNLAVGDLIYEFIPMMQLKIKKIKEEEYVLYCWLETFVFLESLYCCSYILFYSLYSQLWKGLVKPPTVLINFFFIVTWFCDSHKWPAYVHAFVLTHTCVHTPCCLIHICL